MRVLQVLGRSAGGIARHVAQLTDALGQEGTISVAVACPPDLPIQMPIPTLDLVIPDGLSGHARAVLRLRRLIRSNDVSLVHAHGLRAGIDAALAVRGCCPVVVTVHNLVRGEIAGARAPVDRLAEPVVVRLCDRTLAVSQQIADRLKQAAPGAADKIEVLYLGIGEPPAVTRTRAEVRADLGLDGDGRCLMVTVARLAPQKALDVLFDALAACPSRPLLALVGEGPLESRLRRAAETKGLAADVRFLGFRHDVADVIAAADLFCLSSIWEGIPLSVQEAIMLGTPVVSTDVGGMAEIVTDRVSGRLVPSGDAAALAAAIDEVCTSAQLRETFAAQARASLSRRFSKDSMVARLKALYLELAGAS